MNKSDNEKELINFIQDIYDKEIQYKFQMDNWNYDIYLPDLNTVIEYNSLYMHTEEFKADNYHQEKAAYCNDKKIHIINVWEDDWNHNKIAMKKWLIGILKLSNPIKIFGRKTKCIIVEPIRVKSFFEDYHIQGTANATKGVGLYHDGLLISSCLFKIKKDKNWDLVRYVFDSRYQVLGGFRKHYQGKIFTFADLAWVSPFDNVYLRSGFVQDKVLNPDYSYLSDKKNARCHKFNYRRLQLSKTLRNFDPKRTEKQNCYDHGIWRIYDAGKLRYVLE